MDTQAQDTLDRQKRLVAALASVLPHADKPARLFETHISWVLVAGDFACKIKKAVRFDFLDFSTLAARRHYCEEELRLNRRLAPQLYLAVLPVTGSAEAPQLEGSGPVIEYALMMRAFPQEALWSERVAAGAILPQEIDSLADTLAHFHQDAPVAPVASPWGTPDVLLASAGDILDEQAQLLRQMADAQILAELAAWHAQRHARLRSGFERRKQEGRVREGHGDLHCANILTLGEQATAFDCIEFSESLRWIDVMNDIAFVTMDLQVLGRPDLAARLLNRYLEAGGDYRGLGVLRYYEMMRALVRSKVYLLRLQELAQQEGQAAQRADCERRAHAYLAFAAGAMKPRRTALMIMHGFSGSGKTTVARLAAQLCGGIQVRSDVERKRMHGIAPTAAAPSAAGLYSAAAGEATYTRLLALARDIITAGWPIIVDAAFLQRMERRRFAGLARELGVPFLIFDVQADEKTMRARLSARAQRGGDASDADADVLARQLAGHDSFEEKELPSVRTIDSAGDEQAVARRIRDAWASLVPKGEA